jgi:hypothetical protein
LYERIDEQPLENYNYPKIHVFGFYMKFALSNMYLCVNSKKVLYSTVSIKEKKQQQQQQHKFCDKKYLVIEFCFLINSFHLRTIVKIACGIRTRTSSFPKHMMLQ